MFSRKLHIGTLLVFSLLVASIGSLSTSTVPVQSTPTAVSDTGLTVGDTLLYTITSAEFPIGPAFDQEDITFTGSFENSTIGVKILRDDTSPEIETDSFEVGLFGILGQDLDISVQTDHPEYDTIPPSLRDITIPAGLAFPFGTALSWVAGSAFWWLDDSSSEGFIPIPFYAENFDALSDAIDAHENGTVLTNTTSELKVKFTWDDPDEDITIQFTWRKSDGLLTQFRAEFTSTAAGGAAETVIGEAEFASKSNKPLPTEIAPGAEFIWSVDEAILDLSVNEYFQAILDTQGMTAEDIEDQVNDLDGTPVFKTVINSVDGCYYNMTPWGYDEETETLEKLTDWVIVNGFLSEISEYSGLLENVPMSTEAIGELGEVAIPAVTPDWVIYQGLFDGIGTMIGNEILPWLREDMKAEMDLPPGVSYRIDLGIDYSEESGYKYLSAFLSAGISGPLDMGEATGDISVSGSLTAWTAFEADGMLAGLGIEGSGKGSLKVSGQGVTITASGEVKDLEITIKRDGITSSIAPPANPGGDKHPEEGDDGAVPGFDFLMVLLPLLVVPVIIRRKK